jgi:hypothetical protein
MTGLVDQLANGLIKKERADEAVRKCKQKEWHGERERSLCRFHYVVPVGERAVVESRRNVMAHGDARRGEVKGKLANGLGIQYSSHYLGTWYIQHYYC